MNKKGKFFFIISLLLVFIIFISNAQDTTSYKLKTIDDTTLQNVFEVKKEKDEIFKVILTWIENNFTDEKSNIKKNDSENYIIQGTGNLLLTYVAFMMNITSNTFFEYTFEVKDNKFRLTIKDIYYETGYKGSDISNATYIGKGTYIGFFEFNNALSKKGTIKSLIDTINGDVEKKDDNW